MNIFFHESALNLPCTAELILILCPKCRCGSRTDAWRTRGRDTAWAGPIHSTLTCVHSWWARPAQACPTTSSHTSRCPSTLTWGWHPPPHPCQTPLPLPWGTWIPFGSPNPPTTDLEGYHQQPSTHPPTQCTIPSPAPVPTVCTGEQTNSSKLEG